MNVKAKTLYAATMLAVASFSGGVLATGNDDNWKGDARDAWLEGRLESAYLLNTQLNNFSIDPDIRQGDVTLNGSVASEADKHLAERVARSMEEIGTVENNLRVRRDDSSASADAAPNAFVRVWRDSTITAGLAAEYTASSAIQKRNINIETDGGVVTLYGHVESEAAKQQAENMARDYEHVTQVRNKLEVRQQ